MTEEEALFWSHDLGYWGAFARLFSPTGGALANFSAGREPGICQPRGYPGAFDMHSFLSEYNYTDKKQIGSSVKDRGVVKACKSGLKINKIFK